MIILLVQLIDIIEQLHVLVLCLDESRYDLVDIVDACGLHNSLEGLLDDLGVAHVLVQEALLLDVLALDGVQADLQDFSWVREFLLGSLALLSFHGAAETLVIEFNLLIFLFELFLQSFDVCLKGFFALLVLTLECKDLIIGLRSLPRVVETFFVRDTSVILERIDGFLHLADALLGEADLVTHARDSYTQVLVVALDVVQQYFLVLKLVLQRL